MKYTHHAQRANYDMLQFMLYLNRTWNKELECTMREFEGYFQKECDEYFATIKEKILKVGKM